MTALEHPLVLDYLDRLHAETVRLGVPEGRELRAQIREHLTEALPDEPTESEVRDVLDRLGDPADLVDAAGGVGPDGDPAAHPGSSTGASTRGPATGADSAWREVGALVGLVGWAFLFWFPVVNLVLLAGGLVLLFRARRWTVADKVWGAVVLGLGPLPFILAGALAWTTTAQVCTTDAAGVTTCTGGGDGGLTALNIVVITLTVAYLVLYLWTLVRLARRAARPRGR